MSEKKCFLDDCTTKLDPCTGAIVEEANRYVDGTVTGPNTKKDGLSVLSISKDIAHNSQGKISDQAARGRLITAGWKVDKGAIGHCPTPMPEAINHSEIYNLVRVRYCRENPLKKCFSLVSAEICQNSQWFNLSSESVKKGYLAHKPQVMKWLRGNIFTEFKKEQLHLKEVASDNPSISDICREVGFTWGVGAKTVLTIYEDECEAVKEAAAKAAAAKEAAAKANPTGVDADGKPSSQVGRNLSPEDEEPGCTYSALEKELAQTKDKLERVEKIRDYYLSEGEKFKKYFHVFKSLGANSPKLKKFVEVTIENMAKAKAKAKESAAIGKDSGGEGA